MQLGAENFLTKPVDMEHLAAATARVADKARLRRVNEALLVQSAAGPRARFAGRVARRMQDFAHQVGAAGPERADHGAAQRRERHRQGLGGADDPRPEPARQGAVRRGELRRAQRHLPRLRAVRPREGRVHRRQGPQAGALRDRRPRHHLPRRDRRPGARAPAQAAQGAGDQDLPPAGRHPRDHGGRAAGRGHQQGPAGGGRERAGSARTSTTGSASCRSRCRRCATAPARTGWR